MTATSRKQIVLKNYMAIRDSEAKIKHAVKELKKAQITQKEIEGMELEKYFPQNADVQTAGHGTEGSC